MLTVHDVVSPAQTRVFTISPDATVEAAIEVLSREHISALPVVLEDRLVGIFSERDFVWKVASRLRSPAQVTVREIMTSDVITVSPDDPVTLCIQLMSAHHFRHLPVMRHGALVAIISITDIVRAIDRGMDPTFLRDHGLL